MTRHFRSACVLLLSTVLIFVLLFGKSDVSLGDLHQAWDRSLGTVPEEPIPTEQGNVSYAEVEEKVFERLGYILREKTVIPRLDYAEQPVCSEVFKSWLATSEKQNESETPPVHIPAEWYDNYTLFNYTHLIKAYMSNLSGVNKAVWDRGTIEHLINSDVGQVQNYNGEGAAVYYAMKAHNASVVNKTGIVIGSLTPWVESFPLRLGAAHVTTIEYMHITVLNYPLLDYQHPVQIAKDHEKHISAYDWAASFSSLEHSGLGRFGDALDPFGDLKESLKTYCMLKSGGYFFLGLPMGYDTLHWNLHRIYGRMRLALMAAGFDLVDMFYRMERVDVKAEHFARGKEGDHKQFVLVLRKR